MTSPAAAAPTPPPEDAPLAPSQVLREIAWRDLFPFTHLFRAFSVAMHPSKLALAWLLLLSLYLGGRLLDAIWVRVTPANVPLRVERIDRYVPAVTPAGNYYIQDTTTVIDREGIFIKFFQYEVGQVAAVVKGVLDWNWLGYGGVMTSVVNFLLTGPSWFFHAHPVYASIFTLWFLLMWAVFGGAVARIAAVHVARDQKMSVRQALRFSSGKMLSFIFAPIIPLILFVCGAVVLGAGGWVLLHVKVLGPIVLGVFFFLALLVGGIMAMLILWTAGGFNLMYPTIAVEGSDSFDAISRSYSYVYHRPWRLLFYTLVSIAYGALCYLFVRLGIFLTLYVTRHFLSWWLGPHTTEVWNDLWPPVEFWSLSYNPHFGDLKWSEDVAAWFIAFWVYFVISMLGAFAISFYFSASTITYALLRREVDATDLDDVYVEEIDEEFSETPPAAPEKVAPAVGPLAGAPIAPPTGDEIPRPEPDPTPTDPAHPAPDQGGAKVHPTAATPEGQEFTRPHDNLIRPGESQPPPEST